MLSNLIKHTLKDILHFYVNFYNDRNCFTRLCIKSYTYGNIMQYKNAKVKIIGCNHTI